MNLDKPSPELNAAVAEAIGWTKHELPPMSLLGTDQHWKRPDGSRVERWHTQSNFGEDECWPFSTDWAAAMEAAEKVGLFGAKPGCGCVLFRHTPDSVWVIGQFTSDDTVRDLVSAPTGPLAISAAILKSKET